MLNWLRSKSATFKTFVGVRVAEIQATWDLKCWRYVPSESNPADDLSRGISVKELSTGRWINGPDFLSKPKTEWPINEKHKVSSNESREKETIKSRCCHHQITTVAKPRKFLFMGEIVKSNCVLSTIRQQHQVQDTRSIEDPTRKFKARRSRRRRKVLVSRVSTRRKIGRSSKTFSIYRR